MTPEEVKNLKVGDRLSLDSAQGRFTGHVVEINPAGHTGTFKIRWENNSESTHDGKTLEQKAKLLPPSQM